MKLVVSWGSVVVDGVGTFKDVKVMPGRVCEWDWSETGTRHTPGIQPADVEELVEAGAEVIVLSRGMELMLHVMDETVTYLDSASVEVHVAESLAAVELYHSFVAAGRPSGLLLHSTC